MAYLSPLRVTCLAGRTICPRHLEDTFLSLALGSFSCLYCCTCSAQERLDESLKILKAQVDFKLSEDVLVTEEGK